MTNPSDDNPQSPTLRHVQALISYLLSPIHGLGSIYDPNTKAGRRSSPQYTIGLKMPHPPHDYPDLVLLLVSEFQGRHGIGTGLAPF